MARHWLIDAYLTELAGRLPADTVDEVADGLLETCQRHLDRGLTPELAAQAAIAEFGAADRIVDEFLAQAPGRRTARVLLATAPIMGACWGTSLVVARAWTWPIPRPAAAIYAMALLIVVACLVTAASSRRSYRLARLGSAGALALAGLDAAMLAAVMFLAPVLVWPMAAAVPASLARIGYTFRSLPRTRAA
jgi:hypothetical protein